MAKTMYKKFAAAWRTEKAQQLTIMATGAELPKGTTKLGRRPTFNMWFKMVKSAEARRTATPEEVQDFKDESIDLSWDEEKPQGAGDTTD